MEIMIGILVVMAFGGFIYWRVTSKKTTFGSGGSGKDYPPKNKK